MKSSKPTTSWCQYLCCCGLFRRKDRSVSQGQPIYSPTASSNTTDCSSISKDSSESPPATAVLLSRFRDPMDPDHFELEQTTPPGSTKTLS